MGKNINRRSILKKVGAATVTGVAAGAGNVQAKGQASNEDIDRAKNFEPVQSILEEINYPPLRASNAQRFEVEGDNEDTLIMISFATEYGQLIYGRMEGDSDDHTSSAVFKFANTSDEDLIPGQSGGNQERGRGHENDGRIRRLVNRIRRSTTPSSADLPEKYRSLPEDTDAMLLGRDNDVVFRRRGTDEERTMLADVAGVDVSDSSIVTGSDINGFYVMNSRDERDDDQKSQVRVTVNDSRELAPTRSLRTQVSPADLSVDEGGVSIQWHESCVSVCAGCVGSITSCYQCSPACAGSVSGVGAVSCGICLYLVCHGVLVAMCGGCAHCISENR